jgi:hypothetical protein
MIEMGYFKCSVVTFATKQNKELQRRTNFTMAPLFA